jgi:hypothetical protein
LEEKQSLRVHMLSRIQPTGEGRLLVSFQVHVNVNTNSASLVLSVVNAMLS